MSRLLKCVPEPTDSEVDVLLDAFGYKPNGRQDARDHLESLVAVRRAVAAGYYQDWDLGQARIGLEELKAELGLTEPRDTN